MCLFNCLLGNSPFCHFVNLWIFYSIRFYGGFIITWGHWWNPVGLSFRQPLEIFYMQISASIIETSILFNIVESMDDTFRNMVSIPMFSRSVIRINTTRNDWHIYLFRICKLATAIIAKLSIFNISASMHGNYLNVMSTTTFSWLRIMINTT